MARKTKYNPDTFPTLAEGYARDGLSDKESCKKLGISEETFYQYIKKYSEFSEALKKGKAPIDIEIENKLLKLARGYEYEEVTTEIRTNIDGDVEQKHIRKVKKHMPPNLGAIQTWLSNRRNDKWKRNPDLREEFDSGYESVDFEFTVIK